MYKYLSVNTCQSLKKIIKKSPNLVVNVGGRYHQIFLVIKDGRDHFDGFRGDVEWWCNHIQKFRKEKRDGRQPAMAAGIGSTMPTYTAFVPTSTNFIVEFIQLSNRLTHNCRHYSVLRIWMTTTKIEESSSSLSPTLSQHKPPTNIH